MKKKYVFIFSAIGVAFLAIIVGVCFVFFGNKAVYGKPESLSVEKYDDEYYIVAQANENYSYDFKIEQFIDDKYVTIGEINSKINSLKLSEQDIILNPGCKFRFSACFVSETGEKGDYSKEVEWVFVKKLEKVDESSFDFEEGILTWNEVLFAQSYDVMLVNATSGEVENLTSNTNILDLTEKEVGSYTVYVSAKSENEFFENSGFGNGFEFVNE